MHNSVKLLDIVAWNHLFVPKCNTQDQDNQAGMLLGRLDHQGGPIPNLLVSSWNMSGKSTEICKQLCMYSFLALLALCMTAPAVSL